MIYTNANGSSIKLSFSGDTLTTAFFRKGEVAPYSTLRTRGAESNDVIARLRVQDDEANADVQ